MNFRNRSPPAAEKAGNITALIAISSDAVEMGDELRAEADAMVAEAQDNFGAIQGSADDMGQRTETFGEKIKQDRLDIGELYCTFYFDVAILCRSSPINRTVKKQIHWHDGKYCTYIGVIGIYFLPPDSGRL